MKNTLLAAKILLSLLLFSISLQYEQASFERNVLLLVIFTFFLCWGLIRTRIGSFFWLFYIDALLLLLLDYQSRFVVNYFIHFLYFLIIIEAGLFLKRPQLNRTIIPIILIALSKFFYLLYFQLNARSLSEALFHLFALLFVLSIFHYVQLQKEEREKNQLLYDELLRTHRQLKMYMKKAEEVTVLKERNRIGREIHDSVGHELTALLMQLEMAVISIKQFTSQDKLETLVLNARNTAKTCLQETRKAVHELKEEPISLIDALKNLVSKMEHDHGWSVVIEKIPEMEKVVVSPEENRTIYRAIQEGVTNAIRHGTTKQLWLTVEFSEDRELIFQLKNRRNPKLSWQEGYGITSMRERLQLLGGRLEVSVNDTFFIIEGFLPLQRKEQVHD